jgi:hypothetical protein
VAFLQGGSHDGSVSAVLADVEENAAASTESLTVPATPLAAWLEARGWGEHAPALARERFDVEALQLASADVLRLAGIPLGDAVKMAAAAAASLGPEAPPPSELEALRAQVADLQRCVHHAWRAEGPVANHHDGTGHWRVHERPRQRRAARKTSS